ncbi:hypothetical protein FQA39_LY09023 [Lamprigera yunnana]|nr:hypothetical protein FQA39_LY09023 [Lamprigera yunnana]
MLVLLVKSRPPNVDKYIKTPAGLTSTQLYGHERKSQELKSRWFKIKKVKKRKGKENTSRNVFITSFLFCYPNDYDDDNYWIDYRFVRENQVESTTTADLSTHCNKPGLQCAGCNLSILCSLSNGKWSAIEYETCTEKQTCNKGVCSDVATRECLDQDYKCRTQEGMFPDPNSCKEFHYCVPGGTNNSLNVHSSKCSEGYSYNALSTYCDILLKNKTCNGYPVPECTEPAQTGALKENPVIYYICLPIQGQSNVLYPNLDACPNGKKYDALSYSCK